MGKIGLISQRLIKKCPAITLFIFCTLLTMSPTHTNGFVVGPSCRFAVSCNQKQVLKGTHSLGSRKLRTFITYSSSSTSSALRSKDERRSIYKESEARGNVIFALALVATLWSFSIPPQLRREHICPTKSCELNRVRCYDCVTKEEWLGQVSEYYKNGGGIHFDFSVEPKE